MYNLVNQGGYYFLSRPRHVTLDQHLRKIEAGYGIQPKYVQPDARFKDAIVAAYEKTGRPVAILIDEYDKPIIDNLDNPDIQEYYRKTLQGFYSVMKSMDRYIKFGFLTNLLRPMA